MRNMLGSYIFFAYGLNLHQDGSKRVIFGVSMRQQQYNGRLQGVLVPEMGFQWTLPFVEAEQWFFTPSIKLIRYSNTTKKSTIPNCKSAVKLYLCSHPTLHDL